MTKSKLLELEGIVNPDRDWRRQLESPPIKNAESEILIRKVEGSATALILIFIWEQSRKDILRTAVMFS